MRLVVDNVQKALAEMVMGSHGHDLAVIVPQFDGFWTSKEACHVFSIFMIHVDGWKNIDVDMETARKFGRSRNMSLKRFQRGADLLLEHDVIRKRKSESNYPYEFNHEFVFKPEHAPSWWLREVLGRWYSDMDDEELENYALNELH